MNRVVLIHAGPTQWDLDDRIVGNHPLPLTELGRVTIESVVNNIDHPVTAIYRAKRNEACEQAAQIVAKKFELRPRDNADLDELNIGLWQGMTRTELRQRYPRVIEQWAENPLIVKPPEGESLPEGYDRLKAALKKILRRNRGVTIALPLRPIAMQIMLGILRREDPRTIAGHLHKSVPIETIVIANEDLHEFIA